METRHDESDPKLRFCSLGRNELGCEGLCWHGPATTSSPARGRHGWETTNLLAIEPTLTASISLLDAFVLGIVEGLSEFLPISSTGHLIISSELLGLDWTDPGVKAYLIVIQAGAVLAVMGLYWPSVKMMLRGLVGRSPEGLRLAGLLMLAFLPAAVAGLTLGSAIKERLFAPTPVVFALGLGGVVMIVHDAWRKRRESGEPEGIEQNTLDLVSVSWRMALLIGLAQCLALWPGVSRSMVTILAAMLVGMKPRAAAQFSFLLALPTLGAATAYDCLTHGPHILDAAGYGGLIIGFGVSCLVAIFAMRSFVHYLARHGLAPFGWYRIAVALAIFLTWK